MSQQPPVDVGTVTLQTVIERNHSLLDSDMGDEKVMLHLDRGKYFGLNDVGTAIFNLCGAPTPLDAICRRLVEEFDVPREQCEASVLNFVERMLRQDLVRRVEA